jgi:hypothetical protein
MFKKVARYLQTKGGMVLSFLSGAANKINIDLKIVEMIITDLQPISFVEDKGFRNLMRLICPNYEVPGKQKSIDVS